VTWVGGARNPNWVAVATPPRVPGGEPGPTQRVPGSREYSEVVGWSDDQHVVAIQDKAAGRPYPTLTEVDVENGASSDLVVLPPGGQYADIAWATDLLDAPTVAAVKPPTPLDPRLVAGSICATALLGGLLLVWWRRRVRP
jgi:hypothetical protein